MLHLKNIGRDYGFGKRVHHVLRCINLSLPEKGLVLITGGPGSGKSTLLRILAGLDAEFRGDLLIGGESTRRWDDRHWSAYRRSTGYVCEAYLQPENTILDNVADAASFSGWQGKYSRSAAADALALTGIADLASRFPRELSGNEKKLAAWSCAFARQPRLILADEPLDGLDDETGAQILSILSAQAAERLVIVTSRHADLLRDGEARVITLEDGTVSADTEAKEEIAKGKGGSPDFPDIWPRDRAGLIIRNLRRQKSRFGARALSAFCAVLLVMTAISTGKAAQNYIRTLQADTMAQYPICLTSDCVQSGDLAALSDWLAGRLDGENISMQRISALTPSIYACDTLYSSKPVNSAAEPLWKELPTAEGLRETEYELISGRWPVKYNEGVLLLNAHGQADADSFAALGLEYDEASAGLSYTDIFRLTFRVLLPTDFYSRNADGTWSYLGDDEAVANTTIQNGEPMRIVGVLRPRNGGENAAGGAAYTAELTEWSVRSVLESSIVMQQKEDSSVDVVSGRPFDTQGYLERTGEEQITALQGYVFGLSPKVQAAICAEITGTPVEEEKAQDELLRQIRTLSVADADALYKKYVISAIAPQSWEENLRAFGAEDAETIVGLRLYASGFAWRETAADLLRSYSETVSYADEAVGFTASGREMLEYFRTLAPKIGGIMLLFAILLLGLVNVLAVLPRRKEMLLLRAQGLRKKSAVQILSGEGIIAAFLGGIAGGAAAYAISLLTGMGDMTILSDGLAALAVIVLSWIFTGLAAASAIREPR